MLGKNTAVRPILQVFLHWLHKTQWSSCAKFRRSHLNFKVFNEDLKKKIPPPPPPPPPPPHMLSHKHYTKTFWFCMLLWVYAIKHEQSIPDEVIISYTRWICTAIRKHLHATSIKNQQKNSALLPAMVKFWQPFADYWEQLSNFPLT